MDGNQDEETIRNARAIKAPGGDRRQLVVRTCLDSNIQRPNPPSQSDPSWLQKPGTRVLIGLLHPTSVIQHQLSRGDCELLYGVTRYTPNSPYSAGPAAHSVHLDHTDRPRSSRHSAARTAALRSPGLGALPSLYQTSPLLVSSPLLKPQRLRIQPKGPWSLRVTSFCLSQLDVFPKIDGDRFKLPSLDVSIGVGSLNDND